MNHTKEEILIKSKLVMQGLRKEFYNEESVKNAFFDENEEILKGDNEGAIKACWTVEINSLFDNRDFLIISDETGEPLYYQNFNYIITEIIKKEDGTYDYKE